MADEDLQARVERAFDRNTRAFDRNTEAFDRFMGASDRNSEAFDRNSATIDAALERLDRSAEEHRSFMREMILRFEKADQRLLREWTAFRLQMAEDRRVHDQAVPLHPGSDRASRRRRFRPERLITTQRAAVPRSVEEDPGEDGVGVAGEGDVDGDGAACGHVDGRGADRNRGRPGGSAQIAG